MCPYEALNKSIFIPEFLSKYNSCLKDKKDPKQKN